MLYSLSSPSILPLRDTMQKNKDCSNPLFVSLQGVKVFFLRDFIGCKNEESYLIYTQTYTFIPVRHPGLTLRRQTDTDSIRLHKE